MMAGRVLPLLVACLAAACSTDPKGSAAGATSNAGGNGNGMGGAGTAAQGGGPLTSGGGTTGTTAFACDAAAKPPSATLRRLTMSQYRNTLTDFIAKATASTTETAAVLAELSGPLGELP